MKKRILILSFMAASILGAFVMSMAGIGLSGTAILASETNDSESSADSEEDTTDGESEEIELSEEEVNEMLKNSEQDLDEETLAEYSASVSDEDILSYSEQNLNVLVNMDLTNYNPETSSDAALVNDWYAIKDEVGAYVSTDSTSVEREGRKLRGIINTTCEKAKVQFVITFDVVNGLESISAVNLDTKEEENKSLAESMVNAGVNTLLGMGTVFAMLILMSFIISLMKYIPQLLAPKEKTVEPAAVIPAPAPVVEAVPEVLQEELSNDEELVAVISAAIAAYEGENNINGFVVRSIRKHV